MGERVKTLGEIVLDESKENIPPEGFTMVETEIDFLRIINAEKLWIRGRVCEYARRVFIAQNVNFSEAVSPRARLSPLLGDAAETISSSLVTLALKIVEDENPNNLSELLFHLTRDEFWTLPISKEHAARFLTIEFPEELCDLVERQRRTWVGESENSELNQAYHCEFAKRENFLHDWLFNEKTQHDLGEFPLYLSDKHQAILSEEIGRRLRLTEGAAVKEFPKQSLNKKIYAEKTIEYFSVNKKYLSAEIISQISGLLTKSERSKLERFLPQTEVVPLNSDADFQTALKWATDKYLPFRGSHWETDDCREADDLANSFADWILENYPQMTNLDRETSPINLRTFHTVKKLVEQNYWVLWTVVDGLSYENHQQLLQILGDKQANLRVAENSPVFAVLPTITSRAKYGLTSGNFPSESLKTNFDAKRDFFANFPNGIYAESGGKNKLLDGLKSETPTVCYWNYMKIDDCFHQSKNRTFLKGEINTYLREIADTISQLVSMTKNIDRVAVVICSDHGQMANDCRKVEIELEGKHAHGRTAYDTSGKKFNFGNASFVKTNNGETVELNPTSFRLKETATVALGSTYFVDLKATEQQGAVGVHGGLFPEEAVVGLAVLMCQPSHKRISANVGGEGETGNTGTIKLEIDNPNLAPINPLLLEIEGIEVGEQRELLLAKVPALNKQDFDLIIEKFPSADKERFDVKGVLHYEFDDGTKDQCAVSGTLNCKSLYAAKHPSLLNRFKK